MKAKKIVSLLTAVCMVVSLMAAFTITASAAVTTHVTKPSYLPEIKTLVLDEDFEDCTIAATGNYVNSNRENGCKNGVYNMTQDTNTTPTYGLFTDTNSSNKYLKLRSDSWPRSKTVGSVDSDEFVVSFDFMFAPEVTTAIAGKVINISFGTNNTNGLRLYFDRAANSNTVNVKLRFNTTDVSEYVELSNNTLINFNCILKRIDVSGEKKAILKEAHINNQSITLLDAYKTSYLPTTWFSVGDTANTIWLGNTGMIPTSQESTNPKQGAIGLDNILAYAPESDAQVDEPEPVPVVGGKTHVTKPNYLSEIGTVVLDEDFESTTLNEGTTTYVNSNYENGSASNSIKHYTTDAKNYGLVGTDNKYIKATEWQWVKSKNTGAVDSDKFVVSFDFMPPEAPETHITDGKETNAYAGVVVNICFGGSYDGGKSTSTSTKYPVIRLLFEKSNNATGAKFRINHKIEGTSTYLSGYTTNVPFNTFSKFSCIFDTVIVDGVKQAYLSKAYYNGAEITLTVDKPETYYTPHWSAVGDTANTVYIGNFGLPSSYTNVVYKGMNYDNFLAYAPVSGEITGTLAASGTLTGTVKNLPADAYIVLACYDDQELVNAQIGTASPVEYTIPGTVSANVTAKLMAFQFNEDGSFTPLMPAVELSPATAAD